MGWVEAVYEKPAERAPPQPKPPSDIPDFYLRPELIPVKESDDTPEIADRFVRSRH